MRKDRRFPLIVRLVGLLSVLLLFSTAIMIAVFGAGVVSGIVLAASLGGLIVPAVLAGGGLLDMLTGVLELAWEAVATLLEAVAEFISALFG